MGHPVRAEVEQVRGPTEPATARGLSAVAVWEVRHVADALGASASGVLGLARYGRRAWVRDELCFDEVLQAGRERCGTRGALPTDMAESLGAKGLPSVGDARIRACRRRVTSASVPSPQRFLPSDKSVISRMTARVERRTIR